MVVASAYGEAVHVLPSFLIKQIKGMEMSTFM
jgi:hypothetical protein